MIRYLLQSVEKNSEKKDDHEGKATKETMYLFFFWQKGNKTSKKPQPPQITPSQTKQQARGDALHGSFDLKHM